MPAARRRARSLLGKLAFAVGSVVLLLSSVIVIGIGLRFLQTRWFPAMPDEPHLEEKAAYLASIPNRADADALNFVVILFDDLGWGDLSSYGNRLIETPRIDALAEEGVRMTHFYSASSVCTPSRAALLTGRLPSRTGTDYFVFFPEDHPIGVMRRLFGLPNELPRDEILLPEVLQAAGYATGMVGKWHLGSRAGFLPTDFGFDEWLGVLWSNDMVPLDLYRDGAVEEADPREVEWSAFRNELTDQGVGLDQRTLTARYTEAAVQFLEHHRAEPFFLYFAHSFPHVPHFASRDFAGQSEGGLYGDVVEDLDRSVGAVLDALDELSLAENTVVIVTSDNGADYNGSPGGLRGRKTESYEGGHRVPLIVRWPKAAGGGRVTAEMAMNTDLFPTLLSAADLPLPRDRRIDGKNLESLWTQGGVSPHEYLYFLSSGAGEIEAVRDAEFKYRAQSGDRGRSQPQLWRLDLDVEAHNVLGRFPAAGEALAAELAAFRTEAEKNPRAWLSSDLRDQGR